MHHAGDEVSDLQHRQEPRLVKALEMVAPGSALREGIDHILHARTGALICIGDNDELSFLYSGGIRIDQPFNATEPARVGGATVTFEPGARTAWHTHPLGQTLIVTAGCGRAQREGGPVEEIRPGDVVWFPPGEKHWHGAAPTTAMTHIAIQEALDGKVVEWMEHVTDEQYGK